LKRGKSLQRGKSLKTHSGRARAKSHTFVRSLYTDAALVARSPADPHTMPQERSGTQETQTYMRTYMKLALFVAPCQHPSAQACHAEPLHLFRRLHHRIVLGQYLLQPLAHSHLLALMRMSRARAHAHTHMRARTYAHMHAAPAVAL
jgi:hypothetical protein